MHTHTQRNRERERELNFFNFSLFIANNLHFSHFICKVLNEQPNFSAIFLLHLQKSTHKVSAHMHLAMGKTKCKVMAAFQFCSF